MRKDLQIDFSRETFFGRFLFGTLPRNVSIQNPPSPQKNDFFSNWIGLFEICVRSSKMTDPRPCPTGWAYLEIYPIQQGHGKLKPTTAKIDISLKESKKHLRTKHQTSKGRFLEEKLICLASSLNNIKAG